LRAKKTSLPSFSGGGRGSKWIPPAILLTERERKDASSGHFTVFHADVDGN